MRAGAAATCAALALLALGACRSRLPWDRPPPEGTWRIEGNETVDHGDLVKAAWRELQALGRGDHAKADAYDAAYAMERHLRLEGYPDGTVTFEEDGRGVVFRVQEGRHACLGDVRLEGVTVTSVGTFAAFLDTTESSPTGRRRIPWSQGRLAEALAQVETWYRRKGYRDVQVGPPARVRRADGRTIDVRVPVAEGPCYRIRRVEVRGDDPGLLAPSRWTGKPFTEDAPFRMAGEVATRLQEDGFAHAVVRPRRTIDREAAAVDVVLTVERGARQRVGTVEVRGNRHTRAGFLRRRMPLREGELLRRSALDASLRNVSALGLWRSVETETVPRGEGVSDVVLEVAEADSRRLQLGVGWGSWELIRGTATWTDVNFTGEGRFLEAEATLSWRHQGLELRVEDPWVLGERNLLGLRLLGLRRQERFYGFYQLGLEAFYERRLGDLWRARLGYVFDAREPFDVDPLIPPDEQEEVEGFSRAAGLYASARFDRRDHLFLPTQGSLAEGRLFWSAPGLGANLSYLGIDVGASHYVNLGAGGVLGAFAHVATKEILDDRPTLPIQERFFLGGAETVRAFGQDQLTPVDPFGSGLGGLTSLEATLEWRRRIVEELHGALFWDVGLVAPRSFDLDGAWGHGPGMGLRYYTPVGPVRLDVAYNPGRLWAATSRWHVHFAFGFSF